MAYLSDIEIAQSVEMKPIIEIAKTAGIDDKYIEQYGSMRKAAAALGMTHAALSIKLTKYHASSPSRNDIYLVGTPEEKSSI